MLDAPLSLLPFPVQQAEQEGSTICAAECLIQTDDDRYAGLWLLRTVRFVVILQV